MKADFGDRRFYQQTVVGRLPLVVSKREEEKSGGELEVVLSVRVWQTN